MIATEAGSALAPPALCSYARAHARTVRDLPRRPARPRTRSSAPRPRRSAFAEPQAVPGGVTVTRRLARGLARQPLSCAAPPACSPASPTSAPSTSPSSTSAPARSPGPRPCAPTCRSASTSPPAKSRIYHAGAARERIATAIRETLGAPVPDDAEEPVDAEGPHRRRPLHDQRRHLAASCCTAAATSRRSNAAPMRETLAALFLRACGYRRRRAGARPDVRLRHLRHRGRRDRRGPPPGRSRPFAFERLATFDAAAWSAHESRQPPRATPASASTAATATPARSHEPRQRRPRRRRRRHRFRAAADQRPAAPDGPPGLVIVNPPYGARLGDADEAAPALRRARPRPLERFDGWRVALVTTDAGARRRHRPALRPPRPAGPARGTQVRLWQTGPLP